MFESVSIWGIVWCSRACNSKVTIEILPEFELVQDLKPVLVIYKFEENPIKHEDIIAESTFSLLQVYGKFFTAQGHITP